MHFYRQDERTCRRRRRGLKQLIRGHPTAAMAVLAGEENPHRVTELSHDFRRYLVFLY